jgi:endonuclease/exonuclease/phosphatase family metal-dependent hydrolase
MSWTTQFRTSGPRHNEATLLPWIGIILSGCMPGYRIVSDPPPDRTCAVLPTEPPGASVDWYFADGSGDGKEHDRWCKTMGPVEVAEVPSGDFGTMHPDDSLAVASWNTDAGAGYLQEFLREQLGLQCSAAASRMREGSVHFVLLIQEALRRSDEIPDTPERLWVTPPPVKENQRPGDRLGVTDVARSCGLAYIYAPASRNGWEPRDGVREDKGNAILSTLPLSDLIVAELPFEAARRVVPMATVHGPAGDSLRVASVHLITTPPAWRTLRTGNSSRLRQALGLVEALELIEQERSGCSAPRVQSADCRALGDSARAITTIVAGDLNTWSTRETALRHLMECFQDSPTALEEPTRGPFPTDHLLFRTRPDGVRILHNTYRRIDSAYYSDHHPIIAYFEFGR